MKKRSKKILIGITAAAVLGSFFALRFGVEPLSIKKYPESVLVKNVIDGDTVRLQNGRLLRYIGMNAPEVRVKKGGDWKYEPEAFGEAARDYNKKLVEGRSVRLEYDVEKTDKYGRLLAYVFADGVFVNARIVEMGYAQVYTFPPNVKYTQIFLDVQKSARANRAGLWAEYEQSDISPEDAGRYIGSIKTVKGKVKKTHKTKKAHFLNFGHNYKKDFSVVIFDNSIKAFSEAGIEPSVFYANKIVRVTGKIKEYNGPEIIVNHPLEIEVLE